MDSNRKITLGWIIDVLMKNYRIAKEERIIKPWSYALSETRLWCYKTEEKEGRGMMNSEIVGGRVYNTPQSMRKWVLAKVDENGMLWYFGSWDDEKEARRIAAEEGCVICERLE